MPQKAFAVRLSSINERNVVAGVPEPSAPVT